MTVLNNTTTSSDANFALDQQMIMNFNQEYSRLADILGIFGVETVQAGMALNQLKITGSLAEEEYTEGDEVALSKFTLEKVPVGAITPKPYRKLTTAQAILKSGYDAAIVQTDRKMLNKVRDSIIADFFTFMGKGTGTATGTGLQAALANVDAALGNALEDNSDAASRIIHFVNRSDAAEYLGKATITDQSVFGLTYLENFLGITDVFLTNKVASGTVYATPVENIHIFGIDFAALAQGELAYATSDNGLIGVAHTPAYDRVSAETNVLTGATMFAEVQDYIIKGTIAPAA